MEIKPIDSVRFSRRPRIKFRAGFPYTYVNIYNPGLVVAGRYAFQDIFFDKYVNGLIWNADG